MATGAPGIRRSWSPLKVEAVVADYFQMLRLELAGQKYNRTSTAKRC
jgi:hypothetical protein